MNPGGVREIFKFAGSILGKPRDGAPNPVSGVTIAGAALAPAATYRITTNNFLAEGGTGSRR